MATVRLTQEIRSAIVCKAEKAFELATPNPRLSKENTVRLVNAVKAAPMTQHVSELKVLTEKFANVAEEKSMREWFGFGDLRVKEATFSSIDVMFLYSDPNNPDHIAEPKRAFGVQLDPAVPFLTVRGRYGAADNEVSTVFFSDDERQFFDTELSRIRAENETILKKAREYRAQIAKLVEGCNTYKQLVAAWPQVTAFTEQRVLDRHNAAPEKRSRGAVVREELSIDVAALNGIAVKAKLTGKL